MPYDKRRRHGSRGADGGPVQRRVAPGKRTLTGRLPAPVQARAENQQSLGLRDPTPATMVGPGHGGPIPPIEEIRKYYVQREETDQTEGSASSVQARASEGVAGPDGPLPHLESIQAAFGRHDVTAIDAHVRGAAADATADIGAQAFATGNHVAFAGPPDLHTAAHEAAHVVQQRGGVQLLGGVGRAGDTYEQHADAVADRVVQGESAQALLDQVAGSAHADGQPVAGTLAAQPAVQRAPPPASSGGISPGRDAAVYDLAGRLEQLADARGPSNPNNALSAHEMYETWRNHWSARDAQARQRLQGLKDRMRGEDALGYAEKKERFDSGLRDALGPEYQAAENQAALCHAELSSMEEVLRWLEGQETLGRHVTLDQVSHHALDWANAREKYAGIIMTLFLLELSASVAGGGGPVGPAAGPVAEGAAAEGATSNVLAAEEGAATEAPVAVWRATEGAASASELPTLSPGPGGKMLGEAVGHLKTLPGAGRVGAFRDFARQITEATRGQWSAKEVTARNATIFAGEGGEALVFDAEGNMFRGSLSDRAAFGFGEGGLIDVVFDVLKAIK